MDLILRNVRLQDNEPLVDIAIKDGKFAAIEPNLNAKAAEEIDGEGRVVIPGLVESHVHLDKALVADRKANRSGTLWEALSVTAELKPTFTKEDIYDRAKRALLMEIASGTTHLRAHSEFDPIGGWGGFEVTMALKQEFKHAIDLQVVAFPQEGIIKSPGTDKMMIQAMEAGADVVGGVPYVEPDPKRHIDIIFEIAKKFDKDLDIHQDFFDNWENTTLEYLCDKTIAEGYVGRVSVGHLTALGALSPEQAKPIIEKMAKCEMNVMPLPATDLHLGGRKDQGNVRRAMTPVRALRDAGVNVCLATNNIRNAFTPYGNGDPMEIAMLAIPAAHLGGADDLPTVLPMITTNPAKAMKLKGYGIKVGNEADLVLLDTKRVADAVIDKPARLLVTKRGRVTVRGVRKTELFV